MGRELYSTWYSTRGAQQQWRRNALQAPVHDSLVLWLHIRATGGRHAPFQHCGLELRQGHVLAGQGEVEQVEHHDAEGPDVHCRPSLHAQPQLGGHEGRAAIAMAGVLAGHRVH